MTPGLQAVTARYRAMVAALERIHSRRVCWTLAVGALPVWRSARRQLRHDGLQEASGCLTWTSSAPSHQEKSQ